MHGRRPFEQEKRYRETTTMFHSPWARREEKGFGDHIDEIPLAEHCGRRLPLCGGELDHLRFDHSKPSICTKAIGWLKKSENFSGVSSRALCCVKQPGMHASWTVGVPWP